MAELINKKAPTPEPFKIGDNPKIKVKAKRPVLLGHHEDGPGFTPTRVEKDEVGFVTEEEFKRHAHILEKISMVVVAMQALLFFTVTPARAQSYSANQAIPFTNAAGFTNGAFYSTNANTQTGVISGGAMSVTGLAANTTNSTVVSNTVGLTRYDQCSIQFTGTFVAGANTNTEYLFVYPSDDGVNIDTNHPLATIPAAALSGSTNFLAVTNLSNLIIGSTGYLGFGAGNSGTNLSTNLFIQVFVKPSHSG